MQGYFEEYNLSSLPHDFVRVYDILVEHGLALANPHDDTMAIWKIRVLAPGFDQSFSVLVFETTRIYLPTRMPEDFNGTIEVLEPTDVESAVEDEDGAKLDWSSEELPELFLRWIERNITQRTISFNQVDAFLHIVDIELDEEYLEGAEDVTGSYVALVTPAIFQKYCASHGLGDEFKRFQKRFFRRKYHIKTVKSSQNVWPLWTQGSSKSTRLNCVLLPASTVFQGTENPSANKYLSWKRPSELSWSGSFNKLTHKF